MRAEVLRDRFVSAVSTMAALALLAEMVMLPALRTNVARAGDNAWTPFGPWRGTVLDLAVSPDYAVDQTLFAATGQGGVFVSRDGGTSWQAANTGIPFCSVHTIAISPNYAGDGTVFASAGYGVFKSTDGGNTWIAYTIGLRGVEVEVIAVSPNYAQDATVFVGTSYRGGVFKSTDGGQTWVRCGGLAYRTVRALAISPDFASDQTLYAGQWVSRKYWYTGGIYNSTDAGATWDRILIDSRSAQVTDMAISSQFAEDGTLYASLLGNGILKFTERGDSWSVTPVGLDDPASRAVRSIAISPNHATDQTVFIATDGGVFKTTDGAAHWWPSGSFPDGVAAVAVSPQYAVDNTTFAGGPFGVSKTTDQGSSWADADQGLQYPSFAMSSMAVSPNYAEDGTIFIGRSIHPNPVPVLRTTDGGATWNVGSSGLDAVVINCLAVSPSFPSDPLLLAGTEQKLRKSTDLGDSWQQVGIPWSENDRNVTAVGIGAGGEWFAATRSYIYCSDDGGVHWRTHSLRGGREYALCLAISPDYASDGMLAIGSSRGILVSVNRGRSWSSGRTGLPAYAGARSVVFSPGFATDGTMFAALSGQDGGVYKSTDRGTTWRAMNNGIQASAEAVVISANYPTDQTVYVGTSGSGVFRSTDGGESWLPVGDGPRDPRIRALFVSEGPDTLMLAGTVGSGVWHYRVAAATPTPTERHTPTCTPTATPTPTRTATPTATATEPPRALYLPIVMHN